MMRVMALFTTNFDPFAPLTAAPIVKLPDGREIAAGRLWHTRIHGASIPHAGPVKESATVSWACNVAGIALDASKSGDVKMDNWSDMEWHVRPSRRLWEDDEMKSGYSQWARIWPPESP